MYCVEWENDEAPSVQRMKDLAVIFLQMIHLFAQELRLIPGGSSVIRIVSVTEWLKPGGTANLFRPSMWGDYFFVFYYLYIRKETI